MVNVFDVLFLVYDAVSHVSCLSIAVVGLIADNSVCKTEMRLHGLLGGAYVLSRIIVFVVCDSGCRLQGRQQHEMHKPQAPFFTKKRTTNPPSSSNPKP